MVEVIRVDPRRPNLPSLRRAVEALLRDELVIYPTDTVYGLGANPLSVRAVERVYAAKRRSRDKPLPILVSDRGVVERVAVVTPAAEALMRRFWPGALTIVLPRRPSLPDVVTAGRPSVALRMPDSEIARYLAREIGGLIVGTSANISGAPPPVTAEEALEHLRGHVSVVVDAGPARHGVPSTIVDLSGGEPRVLREGALPARLVLRELRGLAP